MACAVRPDQTRTPANLQPAPKKPQDYRALEPSIWLSNTDGTSPQATSTARPSDPFVQSNAYRITGRTEAPESTPNAAGTDGGDAARPAR